MSNLKIYGVPLSRAYRALWMANELGLDYENVPINFADGSAETSEYLAVNPNGRKPLAQGDGHNSVVLAMHHQHRRLDTAGAQI